MSDGLSGMVGTGGGTVAATRQDLQRELFKNKGRDQIIPAVNTITEQIARVKQLVDGGFTVTQTLRDAHARACIARKRGKALF